MNDLHRCVLIGAAIGTVIGLPLFWVHTAAGAAGFWLPIVAGVVIAFDRQARR